MTPDRPEPGITLYGPAVAPYTVKVVRALHLKRLSYRLVEPERAEDYRRWSPRTGLLPVIDVVGTRVPDSAAILDLLDERFPEPPLVSPDPRTAREQRRLETWVGETFFYYLLRWLRMRTGASEVQGGDAEGIGPFARLGLIGPDGRIRAETFDTRDGGPGPEFERRLADLAELLGERSYFFADRISRADLAVFATLEALVSNRYPGGRALVRRHPNLWRHTREVDRETARPL